MRALTIRQPWANRIIFGDKRIENRTWPTGYRGPLAIHAGQSTEDMVGSDLELVRDLAEWGPVRFGAIIGVAIVLDCVRYEKLPSSWRRNRHAFGPWCWILSCAQRVDPIFCRGRLGLWRVPEEMEQEIYRRIDQHVLKELREWEGVK